MHAAAHLAATVALMLALFALIRPGSRQADGAAYAAVGGGILLGGGVIGLLLLGLYTSLVNGVGARGCDDNLAFSLRRIEDRKCFLRCRLGADGTLDIYRVEIDKVIPKSKWTINAAVDPGASWIAPSSGALNVRVAPCYSSQAGADAAAPCPAVITSRGEP